MSGQARQLRDECRARPGHGHCSKHRCARHPDNVVCCACGEHTGPYEEGYTELTHVGLGEYACGPVESHKPRTARQMLLDAARRTMPL